MFRKILVPIDGSHTSILGLQEAIKVAKSQKATLCLLHVIDEFVMMPDPSGAAAYTESVLKALRVGGREILSRAEAIVRKKGLRARSVLIENLTYRVADVIVEQAKKWDADLIVLGTHGRRGVRRLVMGSDAEGVVRTTPVPVLLVRSKAKATRRRRSRAGRR